MIELHLFDSCAKIEKHADFMRKIALKYQDRKVSNPNLS